MRDGNTPRTLPPEWRSAAESVAGARLGADRLLEALAGAPEPAVDLDFARHWAEFLRALADGTRGLGHEPSLAAEFLRAGWEDFEPLAALAEGEAPPPEVGERFRLAMSEVTDQERAHAVADGLRLVAGECEARGALSPLLEWRWRPRPPAAAAVVPPPIPTPPAVPPPWPESAQLPPPVPTLSEAGPVEPPPVPVAEPWSARASAVAETFTPPPLPPMPPAGPAGHAAFSAPPPVQPALRPPAGEVLLLSRPTVARWFLERQLASAGLPVRVADNPEEAVHLLSRGRFRAILAEPELVVTGLWPWAQHAGVTRIVHLVPGALLGGTSEAPDVLGLPPTEEEMERLRRGL